MFFWGIYYLIIFAVWYYTTEEKTGNSKAVWEAISGSPDGDSRNIVSRSIGRLEKDKQDITVDNIIEDLEAKGVFKDGQNPGLRNILKALKEKEGEGEEAISPEQIKEAVKDDDKWKGLINTLKSVTSSEGVDNLTEQQLRERGLN